MSIMSPQRRQQILGQTFMVPMNNGGTPPPVASPPNPQIPKSPTKPAIPPQPQGPIHPSKRWKYDATGNRWILENNPDYVAPAETQSLPTRPSTPQLSAYDQAILDERNRINSEYGANETVINNRYQYQTDPQYAALFDRALSQVKEQGKQAQAAIAGAYNTGQINSAQAAQAAQAAQNEQAIRLGSLLNESSSAINQMSADVGANYDEAYANLGQMPVGANDASDYAAYLTTLAPTEAAYYSNLANITGNQMRGYADILGREAGIVQSRLGDALAQQTAALETKRAEDEANRRWSMEQARLAALAQNDQAKFGAQQKISEYVWDYDKGILVKAEGEKKAQQAIAEDAEAAVPATIAGKSPARDFEYLDKDGRTNPVSGSALTTDVRNAAATVNKEGGSLVNKRSRYHELMVRRFGENEPAAEKFYKENPDYHPDKVFQG